jgi:plastocyanin
MTDESTDTLIETPPESGSPESGAVEVAPAETVPFWNRPYVERYLVPLVIPIVVVLVLVIFVLNLSRVFLSGHGQVPVLVGSFLTLAIILGGTVFSNSSQLRSSSITFMTTLFIMVIFVSGWVVLGRSDVKVEGTEPLAATGPTNGKFQIVSAPGGALKFTPVKLTMKTGVYAVTLRAASTGQHTLDFDDASTLFVGLEVNSEGDAPTSRIFFGKPGEYTFYCAIPGHRAAGMWGTIEVTGDPITLEEAEAAGK